MPTFPPLATSKSNGNEARHSICYRRDATEVKLCLPLLFARLLWHAGCREPIGIAVKSSLVPLPPLLLCSQHTGPGFEWGRSPEIRRVLRQNRNFGSPDLSRSKCGPAHRYRVCPLHSLGKQGGAHTRTHSWQPGACSGLSVLL